jgi:hypothetical protein
MKPSQLYACLVVAMALCHLSQASAHGWYPMECCSNTDCAPVESVVRIVPTGGGTSQLLVTTRRGTTLVPQNFPVRESKDSQMHICVRGNEYGRDDIMCVFMPPGM